MELNFRSVKALSSPTRIRILRELLDHESTPTSLSDTIGRSKSTISTQLATLQDAGLVEKDEKEGRRRVVYRPTSKAKAIVKGRERKVRFSLVSSALSGVFSAGIFLNELVLAAEEQTEPQAFQAMTESAQDGAGGATAAPATGVSPDTLMLVLGGILLAATVLLLMYGLVLRNLD